MGDELGAGGYTGQGGKGRRNEALLHLSTLTT
ncbi:hypothetical protein T08_8389 [Trichinella sp. T8]|nr:hypothetical protein T08_8389 [Trichinella sp. T8]